MKYLPKVIKAEHVEGFIVKVKFSDGTAKSVDLSKWLKGPVFQPLKSQPYFKKFFLEGGTVAWPNGADIAPETLYRAIACDVSVAKTPRRKTKKQHSYNAMNPVSLNFLNLQSYP